MSPYTTPIAPSAKMARLFPRGDALGSTDTVAPGPPLRALVQQGSDKNRKDDDAGGHAPAADGVNDEQLQIGQVERKDYPDPGGGSHGSHWPLSRLAHLKG